jgi:serine/threonine protein kinase
VPGSRLPDAWDLVGTVVDGRYRIESVAGRGGHGVVYRALHLGFDLPVAVKVLRPPESDDPTTRDSLLESFRREGRILSQLSSLHPAFVQAREAGTLLRQDGTTLPYLVLEWLDGAGLDKEVKQRRAHDTAPLELAEAIGLLDNAAQGLSLAHARGISHRDLKPGNLFVVPRDGAAKVKILDFGLAKVMANTLSTAARFAQTRPARHSFTHAYGAPEQWLGRLGASGPWTDVHAWALICVELVSGKPALLGRNSEQLMGACLDPRRPTLRNAGVDVSDEVEAVFARALAVQPNARHPDLGVFWRALCMAAGIVEAKELATTKLVALKPSEPSSKPAPSVLETAPPTASMSAGFTVVARYAGRRRSAAFGAALFLCVAGGLLMLRAALPVARAQGTALKNSAGPRVAGEPRERARTARASPPMNGAATGAVADAPHGPASRVAASASPTRTPPARSPSRRSSVEPPRSPPAALSMAPLPQPQPLPPPKFRRFD